MGKLQEYDALTGVEANDKNIYRVDKYVSGTEGASGVYETKRVTEGELKEVLDIANKQDILVSGTNIKTINGQPITGSGDLTVASTGVPVSTSIVSGNTDAAQAGAVADYLSSSLSTLKPKSIKKIISQLENPNKKTTIKLIGDSITAGMGGTGYDPNGDVIFGTYKMNDRSATCWANSLADYIDLKYNNKYISVGWSDENVLISGNSSEPVIANSQNILFINGGTTGFISFNFYGEAVKVGYNKVTNGGIFDVYIDGNLNATIDTYASPAEYNVSYEITGLTSGYHTLDIKETNSKNASSSGNRFYISGLSSKKVSEVINFGTSGIVSTNLEKNISSLIKSTDDIVICQVGTNDRAASNLSSLKTSLKKVKNFADSEGVEVIFMIANPTTPGEESNPSLITQMSDVSNVIRATCLEMNLDVVDNYQYFLDYCRYRNVNLSTLLIADGLHPNDDGYEIMYESIMDSLGLARLTDGL